jgi:hypothetical protein
MVLANGGNSNLQFMTNKYGCTECVGGYVGNADLPKGFTGQQFSGILQKDKGKIEKLRQNRAMLAWTIVFKKSCTLV